MRSRERGDALKNTGYCCSVCGVKQSKAKDHVVKLDVHHLDGIQWEEMFEVIRRCLLHPPSRLAPLCEKCHGPITMEQRRKK